MLRGQQIRSAAKVVSDWGKWQTGNMPPGAFPLSKRRNRSYRVGTAYKWRVIQFSALGETCRVLIRYNAAKEQYAAVLAVERNRDMTVIASLEFHGTHPGWHKHGGCGDVDALPAGSMRGGMHKRFPSPRTTHRRRDFRAANDGDALDIARKFFRLDKTEGGQGNLF
jgi:hypothetical protein